ncbi:hypothetical protein ACFVXA_06740 [Streptomyces sp. NPDC058246]|uniref:hypothetical protein n=1 Tax=Streptomyces sp. NPDC058246 TaxID=3346400 RepID=UPI0036E8B9A9
MFYDALVAASRRNDPLDDVRCAAVGRVRPLVGLLERQRAQPGWEPGQDYEGFQAASAATWDEIDGWLAALPDEEGRAAVLCLMLATCFDDTGFWEYDSQIKALISRVRGWTPDEVAVMLLRVTEYDMGYQFAISLGLALNAAERLGADGRRAVAPRLRHAHAEVMDSQFDARLRGPLTKRLRALLASVDEAHIPEGLIPAYAAWAGALRERANTGPTPELAEFVRHLASLSGPRPPQRWRRTSLALTDAVSGRNLVAEVLRALAEGEPECSRGHGPHRGWLLGDFPHHYLVHQNDGDLACGIVWTAALTAGPAAVPYLDALALRTGGPGSDVAEDLKLAGATINALAEVDDPAALEALWRLRSRIRHRALRKQLDTALVTAAARQGITAGQLIERGVPGHGLAPDVALPSILTQIERGA